LSLDITANPCTFRLPDGWSHISTADDSSPYFEREDKTWGAYVNTLIFESEVDNRSPTEIAQYLQETYRKVFFAQASTHWSVRALVTTQGFNRAESTLELYDERSNYRMAAESLLKPAHIPADHIFGVPVDLATPAECAAAYEIQLRAFFNSNGANAFPSLDLILLGLGDDGHTASLFPGKPTLAESVAWVTSSPPGVLPPPVDRVTFTFPVLNAARQVMFLVAGTGKSQIIREILENRPNRERQPASAVIPPHGKLVWMLDEAAASALTRKA